jgi:hypothetical protein
MGRMNKVYDGWTLGVSDRFARICWYNKASQRRQAFEIRIALAWKACIRVVEIWRSSSVKIKLFRSCVESTLLYTCVTWTLTDTLSRKLDGCYKWTDYTPNSVLNNGSRRRQH